MNLAWGDGTVFDPPRNDQKLPFIQPHGPIAEVHAKPAFDDEKHFVFVLVVVPDEFPLEFDQFDVLPVELADDLGLQ